ncbi:MAG: glycerol uptake facilitator-like aquaporin [Candidatus Poriferisodalaceae bacterium]|jgi:glycerol uptake facilitator-like aquaporin
MPTTDDELGRRVAAEALGTFFLLLAVIGSGIMAETLSPNDVGLQLLENSFATAGALVCLILVFGETSGAHFNPAVTLWARSEGQIDNRTTAGFIGAQIVGGIAGVIAANIIFDLDPIFWSTKNRGDWNLFVSEIIATFGLLMVIIGCVRSGKERFVAFAVAAYIAGAYFFTSSTSFANPAVSIARGFSDTFAGIRPADAPQFILAQLIGATLAVLTMRYIQPRRD